MAVYVTDEVDTGIGFRNGFACLEMGFIVQWHGIRRVAKPFDRNYPSSDVDSRCPAHMMAMNVPRLAHGGRCRK
jgi:hypothetical protein